MSDFIAGLVVAILAALIIGAIVGAMNTSEAQRVCESKGGILVQSYNTYKCVKLEQVK